MPTKKKFNVVVNPLLTRPSSAIDIRADTEVIVENGTAGVLHCSFKSNQVVSSATSVTWSFQSSQPDNQLSKDSYTILYFAGGKAFPGQEEFKDRVHFIGDINKRDVSIQLNPVHFSDNGTYFCDVKNPPDVEGTRARTELRVVLRESFPQKSTAVIVGAVIGALVLLVLIAVAACVVARVVRNRHDYEGCTSLDSVSSSQAPPPRKKLASSTEVSRGGSPTGGGPTGGSPTGPLQVEDGCVQGPVIYAQLDHSGSKNSFHKMEPVVYADIRKN
ncbi:myelin protein zero-like 1 like [Periophthalmus magnuspinnatus]|uniref:myelin protein zero-like 1 like n=1 Tax=Periophthalmus magnuspinnatus TaxID=409849 RepID=UPI0024369394|nr:myelin protein zero-like 1 like [Periophthalmus magnuspinnatus]